MDDAGVARYLERLGVSSTLSPDLGLLRRLHAAHIQQVPFENLSVHLGEPIHLDAAVLVEKVVSRRRGGFCYELNGAFGLLLSALGYQVTLLSARVWTGNQYGLPFDHLTLRVDCGDPWLVDVGFGEHSWYPLRIGDTSEQTDPGGTFRMVPADQGDVDVIKDDTVQYRVELRPRQLADFEGMCWWHQTSPASHFTQTLICTKATEEGRVTLSGNRLICTRNDLRDEVELGDDETLVAYRNLFGIELERVPTVRSAQGATIQAI